jgi:hypothetical protein
MSIFRNVLVAKDLRSKNTDIEKLWASRSFRAAAASKPRFAIMRFNPTIESAVVRRRLSWSSF